MKPRFDEPLTQDQYYEELYDTDEPEEPNLSDDETPSGWVSWAEAYREEHRCWGADCACGYGLPCAPLTEPKE